MASLLEEYCHSSSVHGLHYVVATGRPIIERIIWLSLLLAAAVLLVLNVWQSYLAVYSGPVQIIVEHPRYPLYKLDFPAVTICPNNKVMKSKAEKLSYKMFGNVTTQEMQERFQNSLKIFSYLRFPLYNHPFAYLENVGYNAYPIDTKDIVSIMKEVGPNIDDMLSHCFWRGTMFKCSDLFRRQVTEEGFCYSFNSKTSDRNNKYSSRNPPFSSNNNRTLTVLRSNSAGKRSGLEIFMKSLDHEHLVGDIVTRGYSIIVHSPDTYPEVSQNLMINKKTSNLYRIAVTLSTTHFDESLHRLEESVRGCSFRHEISETDVDALLDNCALFCRLNAIVFYCKCVPYFFVNFSDAEICGIEELKCLSLINVRLRNTNMSTEVPGFPKWSLPLTMNCSCRQPCTYVSYSAEIRQSLSTSKNNDSFAKYLDVDYAYIDVFYRDMWAIRYTRQAKFGMRDFVVGVGGMAGLLLGCSLVSVVELLYFLFRYFCYIVKHKESPSKSHKTKIIHIKPFLY